MLNGRREFHQEEGDPVRWLNLYGRYADIITVRRPEEDDAQLRPTAAGRSILRDQKPGPHPGDDRLERLQRGRTRGS
jgi:hypothetical protein